MSPPKQKSRCPPAPAHRRHRHKDLMTCTQNSPQIDKSHPSSLFPSTTRKIRVITLASYSSHPPAKSGSWFDPPPPSCHCTQNEAAGEYAPSNRQSRSIAVNQPEMLPKHQRTFRSAAPNSGRVISQAYRCPIIERLIMSVADSSWIQD